MPRDIQGVFTPLHDWVNDQNNKIPFKAEFWKAQDDDFSDALNDLPLANKVPTWCNPGTDPLTVNPGSLMWENSHIYMRIDDPVWVEIGPGITDLAGTVQDTIDVIVGQEWENFSNHLTNVNNPHGVTAVQVGTYTSAQIDAAISVVQNQLNGIGDIIITPNMTTALNLVGLDTGDVVHVLDNGSGKWVRYQITASNDGTWTGSTKVVIWTEDATIGSHTHVIADVTSLQAALDGKASSAHTHVIADVTSLQAALDGKASSAHTHAIADVTNLQTTLDGKAASAHTHAIADVTNLQTTLDGKAVSTRSITSSGLATGGGDLSADRVITVSEATVAQMRTGTAQVALSVKTAYDQLAEVTLSTPSTWDTSAGTNWTLNLTANTTLNASVFVTGKTGHIQVVQDATGNRTLSFDATDFVFANATAPSINTAANSKSILWYEVLPSNKIYINGVKI